MDVHRLRRGRVQYVNFKFNSFFHGFATDVDILLVGPTGRVMSDVGSSQTIDGIDLVLDDEAVEPLPDQIVGGRFKPTNIGGTDLFPAPAPSGRSAHSDFDGTNPKGIWSLFNVDAWAGVLGVIENSWSPRIMAKVRR